MSDRDELPKGLPPGPWEALTHRNGELLLVVAADDMHVIAGNDFGGFVASPEVLRAVLALPLLVEAARAVYEEMKWRPDGHPQLGEVGAVLSRLRDVLDRIDRGE